MTKVSDTISVSLEGRLGAFHLDVSFRAPMRGVTALFGPSGCGKTTILRCIAGLENMPGRLAVGADVWQDTASGVYVPPYKRHIGYVFQEASLFPHIDVQANLLYGARRAGDAAAARGIGLDRIVALLGIGHLLTRSPLTLSGGERQRVAVGRALLSAPRVLLMDEPLSALDRMTKEEILPYFEMLHETLALPIIYVTHDVREIERLADNVVLLQQGKVIGEGTLAELQTDPSMPLLAAQDASIVLDGAIAGFDAAFALSRLKIDGGELWVPGRHGDSGDKRRLRIAVSDVSLARSRATDTTIVNCLPARIVSIAVDPQAPQATVILALGEVGEGAQIAARITRKSLVVLGLAKGDAVIAQIKSVALVASRGGQASGN